jgi:hypothetical protein
LPSGIYTSRSLLKMDIYICVSNSPLSSKSSLGAIAQAFDNG